MRTYLECVPCFARQALEAGQELELSVPDAEGLMRETLERALAHDWTLPPPLVGRDIHRAIRRVTGQIDPYRKQKREATGRALALLPEVEAAVAGSDWPFLSAVRVSIAGNIIDSGANTGRGIDYRENIFAALERSIDEAGVKRLENSLMLARRVVFLADNAGEIVFDRPLLDWIGAEKLTVVVRGAPVINDATLEDAERSGLVGRFRVISNGTDVPGTWLPECSREIQEEISGADVVISKGQGNYETLSRALGREEVRHGCPKVFFLLLAKCPVIAREMSCMLGTFVVREGGKPEEGGPSPDSFRF